MASWESRWKSVLSFFCLFGGDGGGVQENVVFKNEDFLDKDCWKVVEKLWKRYGKYSKWCKKQYKKLWKKSGTNIKNFRYIQIANERKLAYHQNTHIFARKLAFLSTPTHPTLHSTAPQPASSPRHYSILPPFYSTLLHTPFHQQNLVFKNHPSQSTRYPENHNF